MILLGLVILLGAFQIGRESSPHSSTTSTSSPSSTSITTPVLRENFTLLACSQSNTLGLEGCAEHQIVALDKQINELRRQVFSLLRVVSARRSFVNGELSWTSYRSSFCLSASSVYQGGTLAPVAFATCLVQADQRHLSALRELAQQLSHP